MLITFKTRAYANITMFGDVGIALPKMMGHSTTVPGALLAEDVPAALANLQAAIALQPDDAQEPSNAAVDEGEEGPAVGLAHRAMPLIDLLMAAAAERDNVMWE